MRRLLPLLALLISLPVFAQGTPPPPPPTFEDLRNTPAELATPDEDLPPTTTLEFQDNGVYDFGQVDEGDIVTHTFTFTNTGDEPLIISDAKGSCGCTVPAKPIYPIMPGETASITVQFNSKNKRGIRNQKVTLTANTQPAQTFLYLKGEVIPADPDAEPETGTDVITLKDDPTEKECFVVYPNPTSESMRIRMPEADQGRRADIVIRSQDGQLMAQRMVPEVSGDVEFEVSHYPSGTYYATVAVRGDKPRSQCFVVR